LKKYILIFLVSLLFFGCNENSIDFDQIDSMINNEIEANNIPGAVILIGDEKGINYQKSYGIKNPETGEEFKNDDIFRIASMTKAITSFAVVKLWEKGLIDFDDPIKKYIPEFEYVEILDSFDESDSSYTTRKRTKDITIRQLLTHTSGIGYDFIDGNPAIKAIYHKKSKTLWITEYYVSVIKM